MNGLFLLYLFSGVFFLCRHARGAHKTNPYKHIKIFVACRPRRVGSDGVEGTCLRATGCRFRGEKSSRALAAVVGGGSGSGNTERFQAVVGGGMRRPLHDSPVTRAAVVAVLAAATATA